MIITVTPNPTIDRIFYLPELKPNWVHRAQREVATPSGKGVDVSIILHLLGEPTIALGFNAGLTGQMLTSMLDAQGVAHDFVEVHGETRTVPVLVDQATGAEYTITAPTLSATPAHLGQLLERLDAHSAHAWGLVCAGSLCIGAPEDSYTQILRRARQGGLITLLDASGASLQSGLAGLPHILKINLVELAMAIPAFTTDADLFRTRPNVEDLLPDLAARLAEYLGKVATDAIVISLGQRGAFAITPDGHFYAPALQVPVQVTNGAGDAMDAGVMLARQRGNSWRDALQLGTAAAAAAVMHDGTSGCDPQQIGKLLPLVQIEQIG